MSVIPYKYKIWVYFIDYLSEREYYCNSYYLDITNNKMYLSKKILFLVVL